eukprot:10465103-Alexandrium_andersonii.AAC.1
MSASLVGSEMCIRDSLEELQELEVLLVRGRVVVLQHLERMQGHVDNDAPVSYTHLTLPTICSV